MYVNELLYHSMSESKVPICPINPLCVNSYKTLCILILTTLALQWVCHLSPLVLDKPLIHFALVCHMYTSVVICNPLLTTCEETLSVNEMEKKILHSALVLFSCL